MSGGNWKEMYRAAEKGDLELVRYHLKMGVDPNYQHPEVMTAPLIESVRFGHFAITQLLLENGANPNIKEDLGGATPMSLAKIRKDKTVMELLKEYQEKEVK